MAKEKQQVSQQTRNVGRPRQPIGSLAPITPVLRTPVAIRDVPGHGLGGQLRRGAVLAMQRLVGNTVVQRALDSREQRQLGVRPISVTQAADTAVQPNWLEDALDLRQDEALWDEWEDYQDARNDLADFSADTYAADDFQSTTRLGMFDATYVPASNFLRIVVKCKFNFANGSVTEFPRARAEDLHWSDQGAMDTWKSGFIATVSNTWSSGNHIFHCQKDWWESLTAQVVVEVREVADDEHFALTVTKIPPGEFRRSSVSSPDQGIFGGLFGYTPGTGNFDSEDLNQVAKPGGQQVPAAHEAGHMLGLDDEYQTGETAAPSHSGMVQSEFGHGVARGADGRIMSGGSDIQPEHGVTFLAALKEATDMDEWSASPKPPRSVPIDPASLHGPGDFPAPSSTSGLA